MEQKKDDFYSDLDATRSKKEKKSSCSCLSISIFFAVILLVLEFGLYFIAKDFKSNETSDNAMTATNAQPMKASPVDLPDNHFALTISQGVLCTAINSSVKISDLTCAITNQGVELGGKISVFLPSNAHAVLYPEVSSGKVSFSLKKFTVGSIGVPSFFARTLSDSLNAALYNAFPDLEKAQVDRVELQEAVMIITAKR